MSENENENALRIEKGVVIKYSGNDEELTLPSSVTRIAPYAFYGCKTLKKIVTPYKLMSIGKGAFYGCDNLVEADIPGRLYRRVRGGNCFDKNSDIYFRFYACGSEDLEDEDYSDKYNSEEDYLASGGDKGGKAGGSEETIDVIEEIINEPDRDPNVPISEDPESLQEKMQAIVPEEPKSESEGVRSELVNLDDYIIDGVTVIKYIGTARKTTVPDFIEKIGENAFANGDVEEVILPPALKMIGKSAFGWCERLKDITFPEGLEIIDEFAFADCSSLGRIIIPDSVQFIGASAFHACSAATELHLPEGIKQIGRRTFDFCVSLESVYLPDSVEKLSEGAFSHCEKLTNILLPDGLKEIAAWAFAECYELRELSFPSGLTTIGEVAFMKCTSLVAFDLPASLEELGRQAFVGCDNLHLVRLPAKFEKEIKAKKVFHRLNNLQLDFI